MTTLEEELLDAAKDAEAWGTDTIAGRQYHARAARLRARAAWIRARIEFLRGITDDRMRAWRQQVLGEWEVFAGPNIDPLGDLAGPDLGPTRRDGGT
jgi:hypothetical protein